MPSHFYLPAVPAALSLLSHLAAEPHPLKYHHDRSNGSQPSGRKMQVKLLLATDGEQIPQFLQDCVLKTVSHWSQLLTVDNVKHHIPGTHSMSGRLGYSLSLWRFFVELISERWEKKRVSLLIYAEAVSRALIGFKQSILQHWEELWWKQLEMCAAVWGSLLMGVSLTMQVRALLEGERGK